MHPNDPAAPFRPETRRRRARDAVAAMLVASAVLVLVGGGSVRREAAQMSPGVGHDVVATVGGPTGWVADRLPLGRGVGRVTAFLSPDDDLQGVSGFALAAQRTATGGVPPVTTEAFDPRDLGLPPSPRRPLHRLLVTGDSMAMPLDSELARRLTVDAGVRTLRDPHVGTGISKTGLVDWGKLAARQVDTQQPDAVVMFLGANEGFPMRGSGRRTVQCCGAAWAAEYAWRVRLIMHTFQRRASRVYWLTLPLPRDNDRLRIARAVNAAIRVAAAPYRARVRVLEMESLFTPGGHFRDAMSVGGRERIVREADGIHLNAQGAGVAADVVVDALRADYRLDA